MKNFLAYFPISSAAVTIGVAFIASVIVVSIVDDFLLPNFVVPGDVTALVRDIEFNRGLFSLAAIGYLLVLILDSIIALALYIVLRPFNNKLASITAAFRLLYAGILASGVLGLYFGIIDVHSYTSIKLVGYLFFSLHIFILGYSVFKSGYIPKSLGVLLIVASFTYIVFFVELNISELLEVAIMLTMAAAEFSLSVWLIAKRKGLPSESNH